MEFAIEIKNLDKKYPQAEFHSVKGMNLSFPKGEISGLLGPNGAGKTTTISILCGLVSGDNGDISVLGHSSPKEISTILHKTGVVTQQIALYPLLTGRENLNYIGSLYKIPNKKLRARTEELLERFGLSASADKKVQQYSGGMKRRCNIIAALLHEPELLILDEPTAGVDIHSRTMILDFLKEYNAAGNSILYTSHLLEEAERLCSYVAIVDEGRCIAQGPLEKLKSEVAEVRNLEELFLYYTGRSLRE